MFTDPPLDRGRAGLSQSTLYEILGNRRLRLLLHELLRHGRLDLATLSTTVATLEEGSPRDELETDARKRISIFSYQTTSPSSSRPISSSSIPRPTWSSRRR